MEKTAEVLQAEGLVGRCPDTGRPVLTVAGLLLAGYGDWQGALGSCMHMGIQVGRQMTLYPWKEHSTSSIPCMHMLHITIYVCHHAIEACCSLPTQLNLIID